MFSISRTSQGRRLFRTLYLQYLLPCFSTLVDYAEKLCLQETDNITVKFENIRYLFRTRSEIEEGASLLSCCQQGTLLSEVQPSVMTDGALNIYLHILELFSANMTFLVNFFNIITLRSNNLMVNTDNYYTKFSWFKSP